MDIPLRTVVQVDGAETPYSCHGRGRPAVVVAATEADRQRLVALLVGEYRIIEPELPALSGSQEDMATLLGQWLLGVVEGLGLQAPTILLAPGFAPLAGSVADLLAGVEASVITELLQDH
jgi:hypothetical protein